jgi:hypothetical protein
MNTTRFYGHFAAAYGSCWLLLFLVAFVTQSNINLGELGFFGFPAISLGYAYLRYKGNPRLDNAILEIGKWIDGFASKVSKKYFSKQAK